MKKTICFFLFSISTFLIANATGSPTVNLKFVEPSASLKKMWIDYDAKEGSRTGMMMHISFTAYDMKGVEAFLGAYFRYTDDKPGSYIVHSGIINKYHTSSGILSTGKNVTPTYDASVYDDFELFMPYDEINLGAGTHDLTIDVQLNYAHENKSIAWLKQYDIEYTEHDNDRGPAGKKFTGKTHIADTTTSRAVFDSMWVNFDVTENNQLGMLLHFKFTTYDMKDTDGSVAVYFLQDNTQGTVLKDKNQKYASNSGDVAVYRDVTPGYTTAVFDDLQLFMPYDELDLGPGTYYLLMETKLIYRKGGLISNFITYRFKFTKP